jgi:aryl-alcohol dehydrogenase-like predicted oxidoreductase
VGVRYFDVAPWYGFGLAERRFERLLHAKKRSEYVLSSKVGKLFRSDLKKGRLIDNGRISPPRTTDARPETDKMSLYRWERLIDFCLG